LEDLGVDIEVNFKVIGLAWGLNQFGPQIVSDAAAASSRHGNESVSLLQVWGIALIAERILTSKDGINYVGESKKIPPLCIFKQSEMHDRLKSRSL
jgi:hypothetical protein